jgi:hypothetical protein
MSQYKWQLGFMAPNLEKHINLAVDSFVFLVPFSPQSFAVIRTVRQPVYVTLALLHTQSLVATLHYRKHSSQCHQFQHFITEG